MMTFLESNVLNKAAVTKIICSHR